MIKISKKLFLFFSITAMVIYFTSCEKYTYLEEIIYTEGVSFSNDIQPLFDVKCVSCHGGSIPPDLRSVNSFKALSEEGFLTLPVTENALYKTVISNSHESITSTKEKSMIYSWIFDGAENN